MCISITFEPIRAATLDSAEDARLVWVDQSLVALLVPAEEGWFIQFGLGPCEREDLIFSTLAAAEVWVRGCLSDRAGC